MMSSASSEEPVNNPFFAWIYLRMGASRGEDEHRRKLLSGLSGRVIEVGAGSGLNFPFYPAAVEQVLAVEPEPRLRAAAARSAADSPVRVDVVDGLSGRLPARDRSFDAGVASLMLCSVPDQLRALAEFRRVIRPGGELRFYEHVISGRRVGAMLQRFADASFWPHLAGGCHMSRDTTDAIIAAGFEMQRLERFDFTPGPPVPPIPHILGVARRS